LALPCGGVSAALRILPHLALSESREGAAEAFLGSATRILAK